MHSWAELGAQSAVSAMPRSVRQRDELGVTEAQSSTASVAVVFDCLTSCIPKQCAHLVQVGGYWCTAAKLTSPDNYQAGTS